MFKEKIGTNGRVYKYKDLTGQVFGPMTVLRRGPDRPTKKRNFMSWVCQCECGSINIYDSSRLIAGVKDLEEGKIFSCGCKSSLPFGVSASKKVYRQYKVHAENRGYKFDLTFDKFLEIVKQDCHYCGAQPKNKTGNVGKVSRGNGYFVYNGMDRMNNQIGYFLDNIVPCCKRCNRAKDVMGKDEFMKWVEQVYNHSFGTNKYRELLKAV